MSKGVTCSLETDGQTDEVITEDTLSGSQDFPSTSHQGAVQKLPLKYYVIQPWNVQRIFYYVYVQGGGFFDPPSNFFIYHSILLKLVLNESLSKF